MVDKGLVQDYYGPYSPYDNVDLYEEAQPWEAGEVEPCIHLFACTECGYDTLIAFPRVVV